MPSEFDFAIRATHDELILGMRSAEMMGSMKQPKCITRPIREWLAGSGLQPTAREVRGIAPSMSASC